MKPALLLLPGMLCDEGVWEDAAALLQGLAHIRIASPVQDSIPAMAAAAWALLDDLPAPTPIVLAGFSLGGYVALEMLAHPARPVRAAALISTSARPETPEGLAQREKTIAAMNKDFARVVDGLVLWNTHQAPPALAERLRAMMLRVGADVAIRQMRAIAARGDHRAALANVGIPVSVLCGSEDRTTPPDRSQELAALLPNASLQMVPAAGHMLPAEQPGPVADALRALLAG